MTRLTNSLRFRLAATFACFGAFICLLLSAGLSLATHYQTRRVIDETLIAEIEDTFNRHTRNPNARPPTTATIRGYILGAGHSTEGIPPELLALTHGIHQLTLANIPYRIAVTDKSGCRYLMLFNESGERKRERKFWIAWIAGTLLMALTAGGIGWWLSGRIVSPVAELSRRVAKARIEDDPEDIGKGFHNDEIGKLALVFGGYLKRMRMFAERERAFTADVSHELRTPLAIIQGAIELLESDGDLDNKQRQKLARIDRATRQMIELTFTLLILGRENNDSGGTREDECDVAEIVTDIVESHRYLAGPKVALELVSRATPRIAADRTLFGIVVANLIRNALSNTEQGKVCVILETNCLTVSDTGRGIPSEEIGKIFNRYFKGSKSTGEGIGLSLVMRICERYGWDIAIESLPADGTTARLLFAASQPPANMVS